MSILGLPTIFSCSAIGWNKSPHIMSCFDNAETNIILYHTRSPTRQPTITWCQAGNINTSRRAECMQCVSQNWNVTPSHSSRRTSQCRSKTVGSWENPILTPLLRVPRVPSISTYPLLMARASPNASYQEVFSRGTSLYVQTRTSRLCMTSLRFN